MRCNELNAFWFVSEVQEGIANTLQQTFTDEFSAIVFAGLDLPPCGDATSESCDGGRYILIYMYTTGFEKKQPGPFPAFTLILSSVCR